MKLEELKEKLDINDVEALVNFLGGEPIRQPGDVLACRTICHCGDSHKLLYYSNTHLFKCYTECSQTFDIAELLIKVKEQEGKKVSLPQAINFLKEFFNIIDDNYTNSFFVQNDYQEWGVLNRYKKEEEKKKQQIVEMKYFDSKIIENFPQPIIEPWENEGITRESIKHHNICYNPSNHAIVIPHYDNCGRLVGVRERTLIKENEVFGKYRPMYLNKILFNHPLGFNLYNLNNSKDNIKTMKKAILFEGEKGPLLFESLFGKSLDITVAVCGSNLSQYQVDLLLQSGAEELIIAFDRQWQTAGDKEYQGWTKKLQAINDKYGKLVKISFMFDKNNILKYKSSPIDEGKDKFLKLYEERIYL